MEVSTKPRPGEFYIWDFKAAASEGRRVQKHWWHLPEQQVQVEKLLQKHYSVACFFMDAFGFWSLKCKQLGSKHWSDCHEKHRSWLQLNCYYFFFLKLQRLKLHSIFFFYSNIYSNPKLILISVLPIAKERRVDICKLSEIEMWHLKHSEHIFRTHIGIYHFTSHLSTVNPALAAYCMFQIIDDWSLVLYINANLFQFWMSLQLFDLVVFSSVNIFSVELNWRLSMKFYFNWSLQHL